MFLKHVLNHSCNTFSILSGTDVCLAVEPGVTSLHGSVITPSVGFPKKSENSIDIISITFYFPKLF